MDSPEATWKVEELVSGSSCLGLDRCENDLPVRFFAGLGPIGGVNQLLHHVPSSPANAWDNKYPTSPHNPPLPRDIGRRFGPRLSTQLEITVTAKKQY